VTPPQRIEDQPHFKRIMMSASRLSVCMTPLSVRLGFSGALAVVKPALIKHSQIESENENLSKGQHPLIAPWELKSVRSHTAGLSLADVRSDPPASSAPSAKAKGGVGIVLALRMAHLRQLSLEVVKAESLLSDAHHRIQDADCAISGFVSLLSEIAIDGAGRP
jgi:hypothetical protein